MRQESVNDCEGVSDESHREGTAEGVNCFQGRNSKTLELKFTVTLVQTAIWM